MNTFLNDASHILFSKVTLVGVVLFIFRLVVLTALEKRNPAHSVQYKEVLPRDILATLVFSLRRLACGRFS